MTQPSLPLPRRWGCEYAAHEVAYIRRNYGRLGTAAIAKHLRRTPAGITRMATILDLAGRTIPDTARRGGWITLDEAAAVTGAACETIRQRAARHRQLRTWGGTPRLPAISGVRRSWVERQEWLVTAGVEDDFVAAGWFDSRAAAAYCGLKPATLLAGVTRGRLRVPVRSVFVATGGAPKRMFDPRDVEVLRVALDAERRESSQLVVLKVLAAEVGLSLPTLTARARRAGVKRRVLLTRWGVRMAHVTREEAQLLVAPERRKA